MLHLERIIRIASLYGIRVTFSVYIIPEFQRTSAVEMNIVWAGAAPNNAGGTTR